MRTASSRFATTLAAALLLSSVGTVAAAKGPGANSVGTQSQNTLETQLTLEVSPLEVAEGDVVTVSGLLTFTNRGGNTAEYEDGGVTVTAAGSESECGTGEVVATMVTGEDGTYDDTFTAGAPGSYWLQAAFAGEEAGQGNTWLPSASTCVELVVTGDDCPAAAALAEGILKEAGVTGQNFGEAMSAVGKATGADKHFGNDPCAYDADDVEEFLRSEGFIG